MSAGSPLHGVLVVEVGAFMAVPFAAMQLADLGARVIKVEPPGDGDPTRIAGPFLRGQSSPFLRLNRNKESVVLDLKTDGDVELFLRLVDQADVVLENLRPGAMDRLGLGHERLRARNPRLVVASVSGWGQDGKNVGRAGLDIMAQAASGLMSITGSPGGEPAKAGVPVCDLVSALYAALAVVAALRERDHSGHGQHIDVSLLESAVSLAVWEAGSYFADGRVAQRCGSAHPRYAPYQAVRTADGWITLGANTTRLWEALVVALDRPDLAEEPAFADASARLAHREDLISRIEATTSLETTAALVLRLDAAGVPCAPIADYAEVFDDPDLQDRGFFWDAPHPTVGAVRQLGSPMRFSRTPVVRGAAGPRLDAAGARVRAEFGATTPEPPGPPPVEVVLNDHVLTVTFARPDRRNALTWEMYEQLLAACDRADGDEQVRVLVLRGAGAAFAAGTDISQFRAFVDGADGVAYERRVEMVLRRLRTVRVPSIAAVDGVCVGAGLALACAADLRIATEGSRFGAPVARTLGNCLSHATLELLRSCLGRALTLDLVMTGRLGSTDEVSRVPGFLHEVVEDLDDGLARLTSLVAANAPLTQWATSQLLEGDLDASAEEQVLEVVYGSTDFRTGVSAFGRKAPPRWTGR